VVVQGTPGSYTTAYSTTGIVNDLGGRIVGDLMAGMVFGWSKSTLNIADQATATGTNLYGTIFSSTTVGGLSTGEYFFLLSLAGLRGNCLIGWDRRPILILSTTTPILPPSQRTASRMEVVLQTASRATRILIPIGIPPMHRQFPAGPGIMKPVALSTSTLAAPFPSLPRSRFFSSPRQWYQVRLFVSELHAETTPV